jgi:hypothetical protein
MKRRENGAPVEGRESDLETFLKEAANVLVTMAKWEAECEEKPVTLATDTVYQEDESYGEGHPVFQIDPKLISIQKTGLMEAVGLITAMTRDLSSR